MNRTEIASKIFLTYSAKNKLYINIPIPAGLKLSHMLFVQTDNLSKALQSADLSACDGIELANAVVKHLEKERTDEKFTKFFDTVCRDAQELGTLQNTKMPKNWVS